MTLSSVILWTHVLCGVVWVGICATFILAALASAGEPDQAYALATRIVPQINRVCIPLAFAIPITGVGNLFFAVEAHGAVLSAEFVGIVSVKVGLLAAMVLALAAASRGARDSSAASEAGILDLEGTPDLRRIVAYYTIIVIAGIVALGFGLWLSGM